MLALHKTNEEVENMPVMYVAGVLQMLDFLKQRDMHLMKNKLQPPEPNFL